MKSTYFYRLYVYNKKWCFLAAFFAFGTVICSLTGKEITPFFVWGMYSSPETPPKDYEILQTTLSDGKVLDVSSGFTDNTRFLLHYPLAYYKSTLDHGNTDTALLFARRKLGSFYPFVSPMENRLFNTQQQQAAFPGWYLRYLEEVLGRAVPEVSLSVVKVHFDNRQRLSVDTTYPLATWKKN